MIGCRFPKLVHQTRGKQQSEIAWKGVFRKVPATSGALALDEAVIREQFKEEHILNRYAGRIDVDSSGVQGKVLSRPLAFGIELGAALTEVVTLPLQAQDDRTTVKNRATRLARSLCQLFLIPLAAFV